MGSSETIDIKSDAFARRLANLLRDRRETSGATVRELAKASDRAFNPKFLRAVEDVRAELDEQTVCELAALYGAELADILPSRLPLRIETAGSSTTGGVISTSGISAEFDPRSRDSLLTSYLFLVRQLRAQEREPIIDLRREDVEVIAEYLHEPGPTVLERLSTLMGATQLQRRAMAGMFIAGAIVIGLAGSGVAAFTDNFPGSGGSGATADTAATVSVTTVAVGLREGLVVSTDTDERPSRDDVAIDSDPAVDGDAAAATDADADVDPPVRPFGEPFDGFPRAFPPVTTAVAVTVLATPVRPSPPATTAANTSNGAEQPPVGTTNTGGGSGDGDVATDTPPPPPAPDVAVGEPPVATDPPETVPDVIIPDLPFDPPATAPPATDAPATTEAPPTTAAPATTEAPAETVAPPTNPPDTTEQVATGQPPVPPG